MAQYVAAKTAEAEQPLHTRMGNTFSLPEGMLVETNKDDRAAISSTKGVDVNLATLPHEILYQM